MVERVIMAMTTAKTTVLREASWPPAMVCELMLVEDLDQ